MNTHCQALHYKTCRMIRLVVLFGLLPTSLLAGTLCVWAQIEVRLLKV